MGIPVSVSKGRLEIWKRKVPRYLIMLLLADNPASYCTIWAAHSRAALTMTAISTL